jgi:predicted nucleotidyltransferase
MSFRSFAGLRLLEWFLANPTQRIHFKELCRRLGLAPLSVKTYCEEFLAQGWILEDRTANLRIFHLNDADCRIRAMKKAWFLQILSELKIETVVDDGAISFALFGSHASGGFDEKSDIDLIVIGRKENVDYSRAEKLGDIIKKQVQLTVIPLARWEKNKATDPFIMSVARNHVLLRGLTL